MTTDWQKEYYYDLYNTKGEHEKTVFFDTLEKLLQSLNKYHKTRTANSKVRIYNLYHEIANENFIIVRR